MRPRAPCRDAEGQRGENGRTGRMPAVIDVQNLHKTYGDTVAVDDVSFSVADGEIFGILGPNGAGKTTTVECIEGLRTPDRGAISVLASTRGGTGPSGPSGSARSSRTASCPTGSGSPRP